MSDQLSNQFVAQFADATARTAFVPNPATVASGPDQGYFAFQQDDGSSWAWDSNGSAWVPVGGGSTSATVLTATVSLTNAQILALPTTPVTLVAAGGANTLIWPIQILLAFKAGATAYTNIDPDLAFVFCQINGSSWESSFLGNDSSLAVPMTDVTDFFNSTGDKLYGFFFQFGDDRGSAQDWGLMSYPLTLSDVVNQPLQIRANNSAAGNFTGGNAGNRIDVIVTYRLVTTP